MASVLNKFKAAFRGLYMGSKDKSIRIQLILGAGVVLFGCFYGFTLKEWLWISSCIFFVVISEIINTAIERICDLIEPKFDPRIKYIKDLSAGGVLLASLYAIIIGCFILKGVLR